MTSPQGRADLIGDVHDVADLSNHVACMRTAARSSTLWWGGYPLLLAVLVLRVPISTRRVQGGSGPASRGRIGTLGVRWSQ